MDILDKIDKIDEGSGTDFEDVVYRALEKLPHFKKLSMDRQGEISLSVAKMIKGKK